MGISVSVLHYQARADRNGELRERITALAQERRRFGYRRIHVLLEREGWAVNVKRTYRLYRQAGLMVRQRHRKRIGLTERVALTLPDRPNDTWSMDFIHDGLADGRRIRCLNIVDDYTKETLAIEVDTSLSGVRVARVLDRIALHRPLPGRLRVDHGPEFTGLAMDARAHQRGVKLVFTQPGQPTQNAYIESFNGKFRDECLNDNWFTRLREAQVLIESWRQDCNQVRPHSFLNNLTPCEFATRHVHLTTNSISTCA